MHFFFLKRKGSFPLLPSRSRAPVCCAQPVCPFKSSLCVPATRPHAECLHRNKTMLQRTLFSGPTARKDWEETERFRRVQELANIVMVRQRLWARCCVEKAGSTQLLGAVSSASSLRSRVRALKKFLAWLAMSWGSFKTTLFAIQFLDEVTDARAATSSQRAVYNVVCRQLLSITLPGQPVKQAPRIFATMSESIERVIANMSAAPYFRVFGWSDSSWLCAGWKLFSPLAEYD